MGQKKKGLIFVDTTIVGHRLSALVDTSASDLFMFAPVAKRLCLHVEKASGFVKTVNSQETPIVGLARGVKIDLGGWNGKEDIKVIPFDDFDFVIGLSFLDQIRVFVALFADCLCILDPKHQCVVPVSREAGVGAKMLYAIQFNKAVRKEEPAYLTTLVHDEPTKSDEIQTEVAQLLAEFRDMMPTELPKTFPPKREIDHKIELVPNAEPLARAPYRMTPPELEELRRQLKELLDADYIRLSKAPYGAPVLFQKKHDGSLRMCIDHRDLNKLTVKNMYSIPLIVDLFDQLGGARWFTKLDLRSGYNQVLQPFLDQFVVVYLDDIVIYSKTLEEHVEHLRKMFEVLRENELYVKEEKCSFVQQEVPFLGHIVGGGMIRMDGAKIQAIDDWEPPTKVTELRSFLGLANYYRRFIKDYSKIATPFC
ncbi:hypothetical protein V6N13_043958 [Hibiscus sabdariffa]